jgi:hypothetical protein
VPALGYGSIALAVGEACVPAGFVPKRKLDSIPESKLVVDDAKVVLYDMLGGADGFCYFRILKTLGD